MMFYELQARYDARASFYGKAQVINGVLYSYNVPVCEIKEGKVILYEDWCHSQTTLRHVKEFLKQNGFKAENKAQIKADYLC